MHLNWVVPAQGSEHQAQAVRRFRAKDRDESYDLTVLALALPVLLKLLGMALPEAGLLGSSTALGAMAGGVVFGLIAENHGRRTALAAALLWLGVGMAAVYAVESWVTLAATSVVNLAGCWDAAFWIRSRACLGRKLLIVGAISAGKTTLARRILRAFCERGLGPRIAVLELTPQIPPAISPARGRAGMGGALCPRRRPACW